MHNDTQIPFPVKLEPPGRQTTPQEDQARYAFTTRVNVAPRARVKRAVECGLLLPFSPASRVT